LQLALEEDERLAAGYRLLQRFRRLITRRSIRDLDAWLNDAIASELRRRSVRATGKSPS
jgi:hypothetical protein